MICICSDNRLIGLACPLWFWASHTLTSPSCFNLIRQSFIFQLQSSLCDVNPFQLVTTIYYAFPTCIRSVDFSKHKILFPSPGGLLIPHHRPETRGRRKMWQKRADTETRFHKSFRDPTEKNPLVTKKKEFKTDRLPKRACCVLVYFFYMFQISKLNPETTVHFLVLAVLFVFYPSAFNPRRRRHYLNTFLTPPVLFLTYPTALQHYLIVCTICVKS